MQQVQSSKKVLAKAALPAVFALGAMSAFTFRGNATGASTPVAPGSEALQIQSAFENVADKLRPSVVYIESFHNRVVAQVPRGGDGSGSDGLPFSFPGLPGGGGGGQFRQAPPQGNASGSGVIVRSDGYILTNDHVVQGADKVRVKLNDGRTFYGKVFRDFRSDLSLIKIDATNLPAAELADSEKTKVGQWAVAFGAPFGLSDTMTVGVVSSLHRNTSIGRGADGRYYSSLIQTDASINPGNSGGPLVDLYGRVVGINVAIESPSGGSVGIGFAIPANTAKYVMDQLVSNGKVTRGYLGLTPRSLEYDEKSRYGADKGALVVSVAQDSPADKAGLQVEDVITSFNGKTIEGETDLRDAISRVKPNADVRIEVKRDGSPQTLTAKIGNSPDAETAQKPADKVEPNAPKGKLGIAVGDVSEEEAKALLKGNAKVKRGAVVMQVEPNRPASDAGLQPGDVILRLDGKTINTAADLVSVAKGLKSGTIRAAVLRGGQVVLLEIELD